MQLYPISDERHRRPDTILSPFAGGLGSASLSLLTLALFPGLLLTRQDGRRLPCVAVLRGAGFVDWATL